jgi:hypothetical protein
MACLIAGYLLYIFGIKIGGDIKGLVHNIAAAFVAIPCLYVIYDMALRFSKKRLNQEIFEYGKMLVDREALSIISQIMKSVYPYEARDASFRGIQTFLSLEKINVKGLIEKAEYTGFQAFRAWDVKEKKLHEILSNAFVAKRMDDEQIITVITLIKSLQSLEAMQKNEALYEVTKRKAGGYRIQSGKEMNPINKDYPDRYLLLKHLKDDKYVVADFGDFAPYRHSKLLNICIVQPKFIDEYANAISDVISSINQWIELTGSEFLIDTKMFRIGIGDNEMPLKERHITAEFTRLP